MKLVEERTRWTTYAVATIDKIEVSLHAEERWSETEDGPGGRIEEHLVASKTSVQISAGGRFDPQMAFLLAEVLKTAGAMAMARTFERKDKP